MTIERKENGVEISALVGGFLFRRFYIGYTIREAKRLFREAVKISGGQNE